MPESVGHLFVFLYLSLSLSLSFVHSVAPLSRHPYVPPALSLAAHQNPKLDTLNYSIKKNESLMHV
jgi:hypothetical protein